MVGRAGVCTPVVIAAAQLRALLGNEAPATEAALEQLRADLYWQAEMILDMAKEGRQVRSTDLPADVIDFYAARRAPR